MLHKFALKFLPNISRRSIGIWWIINSGCCFTTLAVGGLTRLSESGLSMTNWSLFKEIKPPIKESEWLKEFEQYQKYPEYKYRLDNAGQFLIQDFKAIFWPEYLHRMLARSLAALFFIPLPLIVNSKNLITSRLTLSFCGLLLISQGLLGWFMVKSGLHNNSTSYSSSLVNDQWWIPRVSHFRLAAHFSLASLYFLISTREAFNHLNKSITSTLINHNINLSRIKSTKIAFILVTCTAIMGCLVAGLDAGIIYNTWPLIDQKLIPLHLIKFNSFKEALNDALTVQFCHRMLAYGSFLQCHHVFAKNRHCFDFIPHLKIFSYSMIMICYLQLGLGIATLNSNVSMPIASLHQINSLNLMAILYISSII